MIERGSWRSMKGKFEYVGRELAKQYLSLLAIVIIVGFPAICFVGLVFLVAEVGDLMGLRGGVAVMAFLGVPFFSLLFFSIYANQHIWPVIRRLLEEIDPISARHPLRQITVD